MFLGSSYCIFYCDVEQSEFTVLKWHSDESAVSQTCLLYLSHMFPLHGISLNFPCKIMMLIMMMVMISEDDVMIINNNNHDLFSSTPFLPPTLPSILIPSEITK